jgi:hypothetical protein
VVIQLTNGNTITIPNGDIKMLSGNELLIHKMASKGRIRELECGVSDHDVTIDGIKLHKDKDKRSEIVYLSTKYQILSRYNALFV